MSDEQKHIEELEQQLKIAKLEKELAQLLWGIMILLDWLEWEVAQSLMKKL